MIPWYHTAVRPPAQGQAFHPSVFPHELYVKTVADAAVEGDGAACRADEERREVTLGLPPQAPLRGSTPESRKGFHPLTLPRFAHIVAPLQSVGKDI